MRRLTRILALFLLIITTLGVMAGAWLYRSVTQSLPLLEGEVTIASLSAPVAIERDRQGVPTVRGKDRLDVARALGFLHAQERFWTPTLAVSMPVWPHFRKSRSNICSSEAFRLRGDRQTRC